MQVRTAALCSVPCTHHGGQGQPQAASWGSHHGSPCTCWPSTGHKTSTREASVQVERSPWKRIRRWELRKPRLLPPAADTVPSAHSQPSHSDPAACGRGAPCAWSSELWVPPDHQEKTHLAHTLRRTFRLVPARQGAGPRSPSCLHRAGAPPTTASGAPFTAPSAGNAPKQGRVGACTPGPFQKFPANVLLLRLSLEEPRALTGW